MSTLWGWPLASLRTERRWSVNCVAVGVEDGHGLFGPRARESRIGWYVEGAKVSGMGAYS